MVGGEEEKDLMMLSVDFVLEFKPQITATSKRNLETKISEMAVCEALLKYLTAL